MPIEPVAQARRRCVLVLGMHRSGTSALTRIVSLLGAALPRRLLKPAPDNPQGFWEGERFMLLHDEVLTAAGLRWQDPWNLPHGFFDRPEAACFAERLAGLIDDEIGEAPLFVVKDPRMCRLVPLWRRALEFAACDPAVILAVRNPFDVVRSVAARDGLPEETARLLWLRHVLEAEAETRELPRAIVRHEDLVQDWRATMAQAGHELGLEWPDPPARCGGAVDAFLAAPERPPASPPEAVPSPSLLANWLLPVHGALVRRTVDRPLFDRVRQEIERADMLYGPAARSGANWSQPEIWQLRDGIDRARAEIGSLRRRVLHARLELGSITRELRAIGGERDRLGQEIETLRGSLAWRVAGLVRKPLRMLGRDPLASLPELLHGAKARAAAQASGAAGVADLVRQIAASGLFNAEFYRARHPELGEGADPLRHFVEVGAALDYDPSPWFDVAFYRRHNPRLAASGANPVVDYVEHGAWEGPDPHPRFDNARYLGEHPDLATRYTTPLAHFLTYEAPAWLEATVATAPPLPLPIDRSFAPLDPGDGWVWDRMLRSGALVPMATSRFGEAGETWGTRGRAKILFASHELSRTGAPLILLRLVEAMAREFDAELYVVTDRGGALLGDFAEHAHVLLGDVFLPFAGGNGMFSPRRLIEKLALPAPVLAICNTANTQHWGREFRAAGIPVINLVHEAASGYAPGFYRGLFAAADRVVFPSRYVSTLARRRIGELADQARVIGQGLLQPALLDGDREAAARTIRAELGLPAGCRIVLTCGSVDLRKGADLFLDVALAVLRGGIQDVHFVSVGEGETARPTLGWWLRYDEDTAGFGDRIHFLGGRGDTAPWFLGSDLFLLTSREDPFPCVVHEAMAAGLPLIGFENGSGAAEALGGTGVFVPYLDTAAMARATAELLADPPRRAGLAAAARARVRHDYDFADYVRALVALARELGVELPAARHGGSDRP
jgi:glycosyltransferase involved in cell wall biosynthesis